MSKVTPDTQRFVNEFAIPMTALASQPKPSLLADTARRIVSATVDACHRYNDFTDRAWEIGWLHSVFDDDTLLNETERQQFKAWIIDREMREKQHGFVEVFNAVLNVAEITGTASSLKVMNVAKLPKLTSAQRLNFKQAFDKLHCEPETLSKLALLEQPKMIRHHLFNKFWKLNDETLKYREFFKKHNINVDDFCVELPRTTHVNHIHKRQNDWTNKWKNWIDSNPNATTKEVYQFAGKLMDEYGVSHVQIVKYRK